MVARTLDTKYLDMFDNLCNDKAFKKEDRINSLRQEALSCPRPLTKDRLEALGKFAVWEPANPEMPEWVHGVAKKRQYFENTMFVFHLENGETQYMRFIYAVISPAYLALSPCEKVLENR
eukprot:4134374-Lingulodinium_polyedra.AAC.1